MIVSRTRWCAPAGLFAAGVLALALLLGSGCSLTSFDAGSPHQVRIGISGGTQTLWRYLAVRRESVSRSLGSQLALKAFPSETALRDSFLNGELDLIGTLPPAVPFLLESGADVKFIVPVSWIQEGFLFIAPNDSAITSLSQLAGKRVAVFPRSHPGFAYWQAFLLRNYGLRLDALRATESEMPEQLLQGGQFAAAVTGSAQWAAMKDSGAYHKIADLREEWGKISGSDRMLMFGGYVARSDFVDKNQKLVNDFIQVNYDLLREYQASKAAVLDALAGDGSDLSLSKEQNEFIARYLGLDDVDPRRMFINEQDVRDYELVYSLLAQSGFLQKPPSSVRDLFYIKGK
ncbi:MAG: PhnD/SsuA/transferrin family substrate-binding protein [Chloroflexi bacterium]|nr:PhnD/SsuA/transferrin family substrate-binding protein [Chloroflexota bacterium]